MQQQSLVTKLFKSRRLPSGSRQVEYQGAVADLVRELEAEAAARGLTVSRWQTNSRHNAHVTTVTWAAHRGRRAASSTRQTYVVKVVCFSGVEGRTAQCEAHRQLQQLLAAVREVGNAS